MNLRAEAFKLSQGKIVLFKALGGSMEPLIHSGATVTVSPVKRFKNTGDQPLPIGRPFQMCGKGSMYLEVGDIVLCKVNGNYYLHKIVAITSDYRYQIGNNKGRINGYASAIYGMVI